MSDEVKDGVCSINLRDVATLPSCELEIGDVDSSGQMIRAIAFRSSDYTIEGALKGLKELIKLRSKIELNGGGKK